MNTNIEFYKMLSMRDIFTNLVPSTLTANGGLSNISFTEEDYIDTLDIPPIEYAAITKIACNFGEIYTFPNPFINHRIIDMIKSIISLDGIGNIKIGCSCNSLLDTTHVLTLVKELNKTTELFNNLYTKHIKDRMQADKSYVKTSKEIFENFILIRNYAVLSSDKIQSLYNIVNKLVPNEPDTLVCLDYLDKLCNIISVFTDYEAQCTCSAQYTRDHNLDIDKNALVEKIKTSTRGRKPKIKEKSKRKKKGTGHQLNSQVSFEVYNFINKKITKIKLFRNGVYQVPGVKRPDMSDLLDCVILLKDYLNYNKLLDHTNKGTSSKSSIDKVEATHLIGVMRNYICSLLNPTATIIINELKNILYYEKDMLLCKLHESSFSKYIEFINNMGLPEEIVVDIFKYCNVGFLQISEISLNTERYHGIFVKFMRPIPDKETKRVTVKIMSSGKINIDGANSELDAFEIYYWLQYIFQKYWSEIIHDTSDLEKMVTNAVISDDSYSGYESVYDDQL
ncbi:MAG: hypothetical protein ACRCZI_12485 [Cetobacterium sp.]